MPSHPERVRTASLPEGYQFGDAGRAAVRHDALEDGWYDLGAIPYNPFGPMGVNYAEPIGNTVRVRIPKRWTVTDRAAWRPPHMNAAERLLCKQLKIASDAFDRAGEVAALKALGFTTDRDLGDER